MSDQLLKNAVYISSMNVCASIEIAGMTAENMQRQVLGQSMAYVHKDFMEVIDRYGIHHNAVISKLQGDKS